jgi:hypothetical protein
LAAAAAELSRFLMMKKEEKIAIIDSIQDAVMGCSGLPTSTF